MNRMMASTSRASQVSLLKSVPAFACLLELSTPNNSNVVSLLTALLLLGFATALLYTLSAVPLAQY